MKRWPIILIILALLAGGAGVAIFSWDKNQDNQANSSQTNKQSDPSEGGKYLVIEEWDVRVALPKDFEKSVTYSLGDPTVDPDGNRLQAAKIYVLKSVFKETSCPAQSIKIGSVIDSGAQYIRSENERSFNAARYRQTFKEKILSDEKYSYHLNYITPDCIGAFGTAEIEVLQNNLETLRKI